MRTVSLGKRASRRLPSMRMVGLALAAIVFLCPKSAFNQQVSGTITGYVTDPSGRCHCRSNGDGHQCSNGCINPAHF